MSRRKRKRDENGRGRELIAPAILKPALLLVFLITILVSCSSPDSHPGAETSGGTSVGSPTDAEIEQLLADKNITEYANHCPHGRPVVKKFTKDEVEVMFGRR